MSNNRTEFGFTRTVCACNECVTYCSYLPGYLIPSDLEVISSHLGYDDVVQFAMENLLASPGATITADGVKVQIPTLTPKRTPDGACKFLRNGRCTIHAHAPYACAFFDHSQNRLEGDIRSLTALMTIAKEWDNNGLYAQLWVVLHSLGEVGPPPAESRARMERDMKLKRR